MLYLLIASIAAIILGAGLWIYSAEKWFTFDWVGVIIGAILTIVGGIGLIACMVLAIEWQGSKVKANMLNREYGTDYTQEEIFYASDSINIIRELDRKRYEINGDIRRQRDPQRNLPARPDNR